MSPKVLIVGGTSGIGLAMARRIAGASSTASVTICGRTKPDNLLSNIHFSPMEATSMRSIKKWTDDFKKTSPGQQLDLLVMSQGTSTFAGRQETEEGIDRKLALHYYGRQMLVRELTPALKPDAKVLFVLNGMGASPKQINWNDLDLKHTYSVSAAANQSAVMLDIMIQYYASLQKEQGSGRRHYVHAYPGGVLTGLTREWPWFLRATVKVVGPLIAVTPEKCAENLLGGLEKVAVEREKRGIFWSNLDNHGALVEKKTMWTKEQRDQLAKHTWDILDAALDTPEGGASTRI